MTSESQGTNVNVPLFYTGSCQQGTQHVELSLVHRLDKGLLYENLIPNITIATGERPNRVHRSRELRPLHGEGKCQLQAVEMYLFARLEFS